MQWLFYFKVLPHCSITSCCHPDCLAHTLPLLTRHCVTLAFVLPSCLPRLVVASALVASFLLHHCLSICSLRLLPPICLLFSPAGCCVTSLCTASATDCLSLCCRLSLMHQLVVVLSFIVPPLPCVSSPQATASCDALADCSVASHHAALSFAQVRDDQQFPSTLVRTDAAAVVSQAREDQ
jgi:hypothetical protein